jgi:hypothetical protein
MGTLTDVQTIEQMQEHMQDIVEKEWSDPTASHAKPVALTAVQLVADPARFTAQQKVIKEGSVAYSVLLAETYRAGKFACTSQPV